MIACQTSVFMGVARIFQRGGHTDSYRGYSSDCHLNIVSCLLTRRLTKGGVTGTPGPPPGYAYGFNHACTNGASIIITHMEYHHYRGTRYRRFRALHVNVPKYEHSSRTTQYNLLCPRMLVYVPCVLIWRYSILNKQESAVFTLGTRLSRFSRHFVSSLG